MAWMFPQELPPEQGWPPLARLPAVAGLALQALGELALARLVFARLEMRRIERRNRAAAQGPCLLADPARARRIRAWIGYVVPRVAARLPWRADCLVQAVAAQNWLQRQGLASRIVIGVAKGKEALARPAPLESHAWLESGGTIVTGAPISRYTAVFGLPESAGAGEAEISLPHGKNADRKRSL